MKKEEDEQEDKERRNLKDALKSSPASRAFNVTL